MLKSNSVSSIDEVKSTDDMKRERELLSELLELVQKRSFIVDSLEEERVRYLLVFLFISCWILFGHCFEPVRWFFKRDCKYRRHQIISGPDAMGRFSQLMSGLLVVFTR